MISFFVAGVPKPAGSKRVFLTKAGRPIVTDASGKPGKDWRADIQHAAKTVTPHPLRGALNLHVQFRLPRPKGHYGKKGLRRTAPAYPIGRPDTTKLVRAVEDALSGILWRDDAQIVSQVASKSYVCDGEVPGAQVWVNTLDIPISGC